MGLRILLSVPVYALAVFSITRGVAWWPGLALAGLLTWILWRQEIERMLDWTVKTLFGPEAVREEIPEFNKARHSDDWDWPQR